MNVARAAKTVIADAPFSATFARLRHFDLYAPHAAQMLADFVTTVSHLGQTRVSEAIMFNLALQLSIQQFDIEYVRARLAKNFNTVTASFQLLVGQIDLNHTVKP